MQNGCDYNIQQWREIEEIENAITEQRENFNNTYKDEEKYYKKKGALGIIEKWGDMALIDFHI